MSMRKKNITLSDGIRAAVRTANKAGVSRYAICKEAGLDQATMSKFMAGTVGLQMDTLDRLGTALGLAVTLVNPESALKLTVGRTKKKQRKGRQSQPQSKGR